MASAKKPRLLNIYKCLKQNVRLKSGYVPAKEVRQQFIDYFKSVDHKVVRSSSVKPFGDSTLDFVNAGMNQFKNAFLGLSEPPGPRVVNSQKCIRVGGKHNDLNAVGSDTYHHTFFEMLGNWSFGDYFKKEACRYAWELITSPPYSIPKNRLYVTYHGGDQSSQLEPDFETQTIWKEIGVPENRILPFSSKDNFWEMASTGPCGPCTEIHYDHSGSRLRADLVNADSHDLTELWNLVFIQYKRDNNGLLTPLKQSFVDTGMGLERLVAILQGKRSTYDTDLFQPLFECISRTAKIRPYSGKFYSEDENSIDTNYRILADHVRMITVAISDSVFPENSHGLRRVVRKCLMAAENFMPGKGIVLINELIKMVEESLGDVYPEISRNIRQVEYVMRDELGTWVNVKASVKNDWEKLVAAIPKLSSLADVQSFGLIQAVKELEAANLKQGDTLSKELGVILFGRYGLPVPLLVELAHLFGFRVDLKELEIGIEELKKKNRDAMMASMKLDLSDDLISHISAHFRTTDDSFKYRRMDDSYRVHPLDCQVLCTVQSNQILSEGTPLASGTEIGLLLNKTNFWTSSKGDGDVGRLNLLNGEALDVGHVDINRAVRFGNYIVHFGTFHSSGDKDVLIEKWPAKLNVDTNQMMNLMRNTTAAHIFDQIIKAKYTANMQGFSNTKNHFTVEYCVYGHNISEGEILMLEHLVNGIIRENREVSATYAEPSQLFGDDQLTVPSFLNVLSNHFPVVQIEGFSRVVSFGPNVIKTKDVGEFCFVGVDVNKKKRGFVVKGLTGKNVARAYDETDRLVPKLRDLNELSAIEEMETCLSEVRRLVRRNLVPMSVRVEVNFLVNELEPVLTNKIREEHVNRMREVIEVAIEGNRPYIIHHAGKDAKLEKLTRLCPEFPVMIFAYNNGLFTARCCTPKAGKLLASEWAGRVARELGSTPQALKGHDPKFVCYVKPIKMSRDAAERLTPRAFDVARDAVEDLLGSKSELSGSS